MTDIKFNIARIVLCTETEGPFKRLAIWFQGCDKSCPGCCNQELQEIKKANVMLLEDIIEIIEDSKEINEIEGITFLGGEPTLQLGLVSLATEIRKLDLGTILFTGKLLSELNDDLVNSMDLIIDGEFYINEIDNQRNLIGSSNQIIYLIKDRYKEHTEWFLNKRQKSIDINITNNNLYINGDVIN